MSQKLDPEDYRDVLRQYQGVCSTIVERYDGHIAQYLGDGVLVYFGYPKAHEDTPQRAVRAGLAIIQAIQRLSPGLQESRAVTLRVRVGIHTGTVVVGQMGDTPRHDSLAVGETPNMAAGIQQTAAPDSVVVSETTYRQARGFFTFRDIGPQILKGFPRPAHLYQALSETDARTRLDVAATGGLTPFVGRDKEMAVLLEKWKEAKSGKAPVVLLSGEPGIGKSRHVRVLKDNLAGEAHTIVECFCSPFFQSTALQPIVEMIERRLVFARDVTPDQKLRRIESELVGLGFEISIAVPVIASLLSVPVGDRCLPADLLPPKQRQLTFDILLAWVHERTRHEPVLLVFEDLHWADPSTLEFVGLLIQRDTPGALLTLLTHRPDFRPPWSSPRLSGFSLGRLPLSETKKMLIGVAREKILPAEVVDRVLAKADGVPLYVEEITKAVLESSPISRTSQTDAAAASADIQIPSTIQDSLVGRLDRLGTGKAVAQWAATIGRTCRFELLHAVCGMEEEPLRSELDRLVSAELMFRRGEPPNETYIFKHALIQDAAYESLLRSTRQNFHRKIAQALNERLPELANAQPELLAQHFGGAGMTEQAADQWALAGQHAIARSAYSEAIEAFGRALNQMLTLPESTDRDRKEAELLCGLGLAFISVKGWSTKEVEETYGRAYELRRRLGELPIRVLFGVWAVYIVRGDRERTAELVPHVRHVLENSKDPNDLLIVNALLGARSFWSGEYRAAVPLLTAGKQYCDRRDPRRQAIDLLSNYGYEGQLYPHVFLAWTDIVQGRARQAAQGIEDAITIARATAHPYVEAVALSFGAAVAHEMGDVVKVEERGNELTALALRHGFPFFSANGLSFKGWVALQRGDIEGALKDLSDAIGIYRALGAEVVVAYYLSYLVEAYIGANKPDDGLKVVEDALRLVETNLAAFCEPELHRLRGDLLILKGDVDGARLAFHRAHTVARQQGAVLFEARAVLSMARSARPFDDKDELRQSITHVLQALPGDDLLAEHKQLLDLAATLNHTA